MTKKQIIIMALSVFFVLAFTLVGAIIINNYPDKSVKNISVMVVFQNGRAETMESTTDCAYLADALKGIGILSDKSENGVYDTVNFTKAVNGAEWVFYRNGKKVNNIEKCLIKDKDKIEIHYKGTNNENQ